MGNVIFFFSEHLFFIESKLRTLIRYKLVHAESRILIENEPTLQQQLITWNISTSR